MLSINVALGSLFFNPSPPPPPPPKKNEKKSDHNSNISAAMYKLIKTAS